MAVGYDEQYGTVYESSLPPKAGGVGIHAVLAFVTIGVTAGLAAFGLHEAFDHFQGAGHVINHGVAHELSGMASNHNGLQRFGDSVNGLDRAWNEHVAPHGDHLIHGTKDVYQSLVDPAHSDFGNLFASISHPATLPDNAVQQFLHSGQDVQQLANGNFLVRVDNSNQVMEVMRDRLANVPHEVLERFPPLKALSEASAGKPFSFEGIQNYVLGGAGAGVAVAGVAQATATPASSNPYMRPGTMAQMSGAVYGQTLYPAQQRVI